jgi:hypothetical protein
MLSYTGQRNFFGTKVNNSDSTILTIADGLINDHRRQVLSKRMWWFLEKAVTFTTVALTQGYVLQGNIERIVTAPTVTIGTVRYTPKEAYNYDFWNRLNLVTYSSDIPEWWWFSESTLYFFPQPNAGGKTATVVGKQKVIDLSIADYTTGTIVTATNGSPSIVGSGTSWTTGMAGMWLKITKASAANAGDGTWYQIASVDSATTLTLARNYGGTSIVAGSALYTIGECSILPEQYDALPIYQALAEYFTSNDPNETKAARYDKFATDLMRQMEAEQSNRSGGRVIDEGIDKTSIINPNLTIGF